MNHPLRETTAISSQVISCNARLRLAKLIPLVAALGLAAGCAGNSSAKPSVGAIQFTNASGTPYTALKQLTTGESTYVDVAVTNDRQQLGADWSSYCGSALPPGTPLPTGQTQDQSCGTFTPGHTASGPIPVYVTNGSGYVTLFTAPAGVPKEGTVTLYATTTSDRSQLSHVTLTITTVAVSVQLAPAPPASLNTGATVSIKAVVNNDSQNGGVTWSATCGSSDCGSFKPATSASGVATVYTAPAATPIGGSVQVTATSITDLNKAASSTIQITTPPTSMDAAASTD